MHDEYLQGPTAEELYRGLSTRLHDWGHHTSSGALGAFTPRAIAVLALYAGHRVAIRYTDEHGDLNVAAGMTWDVKGDEVVIFTPDNRPGLYETRIPVDAIISVEVMAYDAIVREGDQ
jgi:hypothetical protein